MHILFVIIALGGTVYFGFANRRLDAFCLAFLGALAYFCPGFVGDVPYASTGYWIDPFVALVPGAYGVMIIVLGAIWLAALLYEHGALRQLEIPVNPRMHHLAAGFTAVALIGFVGFLATEGFDTLQMTEKEQIMEHQGRFFTLWSVGATLGFVVAFVLRKYVQLAICTLLLLGCLYAGSRVEFVISLISAFFVYAASADRQRLVIRFRRWIAPVALVGFFVLIFKVIYVGVKFDDYWFIYDKLADPQTYANSIFYSEPFYVQSTLNEVVANDFSVGLDHLMGIFFLLIPFSTEFGVKPLSFNDLFQPALFPQAVSYGLANNIWAQMWSAGGWPLLILFVLVFCAAIAAGEAARRKAGPEVHAIIVVALAYWCFYIHRNDLLVTLQFERYILLVSLGAYMISRLLVAFVRRRNVARSH